MHNEPFWSDKYLGLGFSPAPDNCWRLVCRVIKEQLGEELPPIHHHITPKMAGLAWEKRKPPYKNYDVVFFHTQDGARLHAGIIALVGGEPRVLEVQDGGVSKLTPLAEHHLEVAAVYRRQEAAK